MNEKLERLVHTVDEVEDLTEDIKETAERQRRQAEDQLQNYADTDLDEELVEAFFDKPYRILPKSEDEAWVVAPRFVPFNVGWLDRQDDAWNVFVVNKYVDWIGELPDEIRDAVGIDPEYEEATVDGGMVEFSSREERERAWEDMGGRDGGLHARKEDTKIKVQNGHEFDVIASLVEKGNLPFKPRPVEEEMLRGESGDGVELRSYQERAWEKYLETGMIGVYWPPGAGKTFLALYAGDRVEGEKLVVVPNNTLKEQWKNRIEEFCRDPSEWEVQTYQYITQYHMDEYQNKDLALTIFDESHHLPANQFSKLSTINTDTRIGLSASPHREDERTEYIFALTGYPVGMNWQELVEMGAVDEPDVSVYLYKTKTKKRKGLEEVVNSLTGKVVVFCDSLDEGERISSLLGVPFVQGKTRNRMEVFEENRVVVSSRVGDEGLSLDDLDAVVEYDFHGGSRRQEIQRAGRVMHGDSDGRHIVMMTDEEHQKHEKRLYSLEEKGFQVRKERKA